MLGRIGDRGIDARDFLQRLWLTDNKLARFVLEQIVFDELTMLESNRLGIRVSEAVVDAQCARTIAALEKKLVDGGSKLSFDDHVRLVIQLDPAQYRRNVRADTLMHMLAERCVRTYMRESDCAVARITEVRDAEALAGFRADLAAGKSFADVARTWGAGDDEATHTTRITLARAESQGLARIVFATPVGEVGGPFEQSGRWLFFEVESRSAGREGSWAEIGPEIERSLVEQALDQEGLEFRQWHAAMTQRYALDLAPFFAIVERPQR